MQNYNRYDICCFIAMTQRGLTPLCPCLRTVPVILRSENRPRDRRQPLPAPRRGGIGGGGCSLVREGADGFFTILGDIISFIYRSFYSIYMII